MIRIVHTVPRITDELVADLPRLRSLVAEAELYRTIAAGDSDGALTLLCEDESAYSAVLASAGDLPGYRQVLAEGTVEVYRQEPYRLDDGVWVPRAGHEPGIVWPADGPVRIVISYAVAANESLRELTEIEIADTRREPGCLHYAWYENVDLPDHLLLLELWQDQRIYDLHWDGRLRTADYRGDSGRAPRDPDRGSRTLEFYRHQEFTHHYGRLLPQDPARYSTSVVWTAR